MGVELVTKAHWTLAHGALKTCICKKSNNLFGGNLFHKGSVYFKVWDPLRLKKWIFWTKDNNLIK